MYENDMGEECGERLDGTLFCESQGIAMSKKDYSKNPEPEKKEQPSLATMTRSTPKAVPTRKQPQQLPPYKVLLHNDDVNTFEHVVLSIIKLTTLSMEMAALKTLEAHEHRVSLLLVTHKERAELYQEQFTSVGLTVTIEPDVSK